MHADSRLRADSNLAGLGLPKRKKQSSKSSSGQGPSEDSSQKSEATVGLSETSAAKMTEDVMNANLETGRKKCTCKMPSGSCVGQFAPNDILDVRRSALPSLSRLTVTLGFQTPDQLGG